MSFRKISNLIVFSAVILLGSVTVFGQTVVVGGQVFKMDADGKQTPVEGVRIDCYRTDISQSCRTVTTDKNGEFTIIGLPISAKIVLGVSGPGLEPTVVPEMKASEKGADKIGIPVKEGDGSVPVEADVRKAGTYTGDLTADQKAEQAELERKRKEIESKNAKIEERNAQRVRLLKEGEAAFNGKDYATAILKFKEGYELDPDFVGSAPTFLNNMSLAQKAEAVVVYNDAVKAKQTSQIRPKIATMFKDSLTAALRAHEISTNAKPGEILDASKNKSDIKLSEELVTESFRILGQLKLNLAGYVGTEEEAKASVALYKSSLGILPKNADVIAGLTFALYTSSALTGNESEKQESLNYGAHYLAISDQGHGLREAVTEIVDLIKSEGLSPKPVK